MTTDKLIDEAVERIQSYANLITVNFEGHKLVVFKDILPVIIRELQAIASKSAESVRETTNIVWICSSCAELFSRKLMPTTNIYTQVFRKCECCGEDKHCMHVNSYDSQPRKGTHE